jgi:hypothetical protein
MNYTGIDSTSLIDGSPNDVISYNCASANRTCLKLHSGAILMLSSSPTFGGTNTTNLAWFLIDPDATYKGDRNSLWGARYYNGRVTTWGTVAPNSVDSGGGVFNSGNYDPTWFSW